MIIYVDGSTTNKQFLYRTFIFHTRWCCGVLATALVRALLLASCVHAAVGQGCEDRDFRCVDTTHYAVCLPRELRSKGWTTDPEVSCPEGTFCDERSPARCSPQPQSNYRSLLQRVARSLDHTPQWQRATGSECPDAGRFPVAGSCDSLLVCIPSLGGLRVRRASCPSGAVFDRVSRRCVSRSLLPRDPRNAACLPKEEEEAAGRRKRSAEQPRSAEVAQETLQKRVPQPLPQPQQAVRSLAAAIYVGPNVTEMSPAGPYGRCGEGETWDASLGQCMLTDERSIGPAVHCDGRGVFPDRGNPNAYISCDPLVTGEGFVAHRYWCPVSMQFDPSSRVCRTYSSKRQRNSEKSRRRTDSLPRPEVASVNDEASNPLDGAAEGEWSQEDETEEKVRSQRELYKPDSSQSSDTDSESFNGVNDNGQIERSDTNQITDAVRNTKEVPGHSQEERAAKSSVNDGTKILSPVDTNSDPENAKDVLKRDDSDMEERQLVASADNSGSSEEDSIAADVKSADPAQNRITLNQEYISANNEDQGFEGDSEQANIAFQIQNEDQQHEQMKRVAESVVPGWANKVSAVETNAEPTRTKNVLRREEVNQNHQLISNEETDEGRDADRATGGQKLSETDQNRLANNVGYVDTNNNELAFRSDSDQDSASFQSQNAAQSDRQMADLGENSVVGLNDKVSPLESDSDPIGALDVLKRGEVEENQLDSDAYSIEGGEEDGLQGNVGVEDIEKAANSDYGQIRVESRDLSQARSHDQMKTGEEKAVVNWSNEVSADDGSASEKKMLKRDEVEHGHPQVSGADIGEVNEADELRGYADVNSNGPAIVGDSEQVSVDSQSQNEAQNANQMKRVAKSFSVGWPNKITGVIKDDGAVDPKEVLKRDKKERNHQMFSSVDNSDDDPVAGEDELSDSGDLDEGIVYNTLRESSPCYHRPGRRDNDAEINVASETVNGETRDSWSKEELVANSDTSDVSGSGGDSRRSLPVPRNELRLSEGKRSVDNISQNKAEQRNNDVGASVGAPGQYYEGDHLSKGSPDEHSELVGREVSSSNVQKTSSSDEMRNTGGSHESHDKFLEEQDEILRQLSSMKQRSAVNKVRNNVEASKERLERSESPRDKQSLIEGNRHVILLKAHEVDVPGGERASEQVNSLDVPASLQGTARSPKQLTGDKRQADEYSKERPSARKEKLSVSRRQHSEKETKGHTKREEGYRTTKNGVEKRESRTSSRTAERSDPDKLKQRPKNVREGKQKGESLVNIDQIIREAERLSKIKAAPRRPAVEYLDKQKRNAGAKTVSQTSTGDPKRAGKNEGKEGRGKSSREVAGTKLVGTLNPAPRVTGSVPGKADRKGDTKVSGKVTREVMEKKQTSNLNPGLMTANSDSEREDKRQDNEASAKAAYGNTGKNPVNSLTPVIEEIISNSVNKYSKFPPVSVQQNQKSESKSAIKDREVQQSIRRTNGYEDDPNVSLQGKTGPIHENPKTEKKGMNRDTKEHAGHRATPTKESGFHQSGYISIGPMNKLARFQRNGRNMIYDVTSLSDNKNGEEVENDSLYAPNSRRRAVYSSHEGRNAAVPEDAIGIRTLISTKRSDNKHDGKFAPSISNRSAKEVDDHEKSKETKSELDKQVTEARHESRDVASTKTDVAGHLRSLSSFDDKSNKNEASLQKAEISDKGASKRTAIEEEPSRSEQEANYEKMPENAPSAGVTRSSRRIDDVRGDNDTPLLNALRKSVEVAPFGEAEDSSATAFQCPGGGSYPYRQNERAYYSCVPTADGSGFVATLRSCSENEVFDPITRACTSRDIMPSLEYKSGQLLQSASVVARSPADEPLENPCTAEGRISNPYDCSAFYLCLPKRSGSGAQPDFFHIALRCPKGSIFDTESRQCVEGSPTTCIPEYKLLDKLRRRRGRMRSQSASRASRSAEEACPRPGRFARADGGCGDYVLCARPGGVGPLLAVPVRCPAGLAFSAERARCVSPDVAGCQPDP